MNNYQLITLLFLVLFVLGGLITAGVEELIKRHKQNKKRMKSLELENRILKQRIAGIRIVAELKGLDLHI